MLALILCAIIVIAIFAFAYKRKKLADALPPGPPGWPLIGNIGLQFDKDVRQTLLKWHKQYGPMYTVWSGLNPEVYVTGYQLMHELFVKRGDEFVDRPDDWLMLFLTSGQYGILNSSGEQMREQRRFTLQTLRNFGFGRKIMEEKVTNEAEKFVKAIEKKLNGSSSSKSKVMSVKEDLELCIGNIISSLVVGRTYESGDPTFLRIKYNINKNFETLGSPIVFSLSSLPWLRFIPFFNSFGLDKIKSQLQHINEILLEEVEKHKKEIEETTEPTDFTAAYLQEMKRRKDTGQDMSYFSEWQLVSIMGDLWAAGLETTITTMGWAILLMMKNPDIQVKVHKELDSVLGFEKQPSLADKPNLPYVNAVLQEVQRYSNIAPTNFGRRVAKDTVINGYVLPAGTAIYPQMSVVHIDDEVFIHPQDFNPDRFLESGGKALKKCEELIPFSLGKRSCLGESLARLELFIIFTFIMQKFKFEIDPNQPELSLEPVVGFTVTTKPYDCLVTARF